MDVARALSRSSSPSRASRFVDLEPFVALNLCQGEEAELATGVEVQSQGQRQPFAERNRWTAARGEDDG